MGGLSARRTGHEDFIIRLQQGQFCCYSSAFGLDLSELHVITDTRIALVIAADRAFCNTRVFRGSVAFHPPYIVSLKEIPMPIDLSTLTDTLSDGLSSLLSALSDPSTVAATTTAATTTGSATSTTAITGTGLSLFVKTAPLALIAAHPVTILAALGGGLGVIGLIDVVSDFRENRRNKLETQLQAERVQEA